MPRRDDQDVGEQRELRQIAGFRVTNGHGRFALHQHQCHRLADDIARADNDDVFALERNILVFKQLQHPIGRTGRKYRASRHESADIVEMEAVNILVDRNGVQDARHIERWRQRQLNQDAVNGRIIVEVSNSVDYNVLLDIERIIKAE